MSSLWKKFLDKGFKIHSMDSYISNSIEKTQMDKTLGLFDVICLGVGMTIGSGIFVVTGEIAKSYAGPSVTLSYAIAFFAALFSALCYCEFVVDLPFAGSSYNYISYTFGEFLGWIGISNVVLEYCLGTATVAKGFTSYFTALFSLDSSYYFIQILDWLYLDIPALVIILIMCIVNAASTKKLSGTNITFTIITVSTILLVIFTSIPYLKVENMQPYIPEQTENGNYGIQGIFAGASVAFFSYIGFDLISLSAEDAKKPERNIPIAMVLSLLISNVLYLFMAAVLVGMENYRLIDINAPYAVVFENKGLWWISKLVTIGALAGILSTIAGLCMGQSRIYMVIGREGFIPSWTGIVNKTTNTPINATIVTFLFSSIPALFFDISVLSSLVSMGTLFVFCIVCCGVIWRRYSKEGNNKNKLAIALGGIIVSSILEGISYELSISLCVTFVFLGLWVVSTIACMTLDVEFKSNKFKLPLQPVIPAIGILTNVHLICSLGMNAYIRFGCWQFFVIAVYIFYGIHRTTNNNELHEPILA